MTNKLKQHIYIKKIESNETLESHLFSRIHENINAEITLKSLINLETTV